MDVPLRNAIFSAELIPSFDAAFAVLALPFTAARMPKNPARTEKRAPTT
jgi:hypothetical protein